VTDDRVPPDAIVRTALQLLPVPPHGAAFWAELDDRLDAERAASVPVLAAVPGPSTDSYAVTAPALVPAGSTALVPPALRRGSNAVLAAMAVAAVVVVVVAGGSLLSERRTTEVVEPTERAAADLDAAFGDQPLDGVLVSMSSADQERSADAVLAWVRALRSGDAEAAWSALGEASRRHFGSSASFAGELATLAAAQGAWATTEPDDVLVTPLATDGDDLVAIVTLVGEIELDGELVRRADAFPVRMVDGEVVLEAFAAAGLMELVVPEGITDMADRPVVATDDELVLVVPDRTTDPVLRLDDGDPVVCGEAAGTELIPMADLPGRRCSWRPAGGIPAGGHTLTVAYRSGDGTGISAESVLFEAA
jgi:hypothetical protein